MKVHQNIYNNLKIVKPVVTIGTFDGIHIGHQKIIDKINQLAKINGGESVLITFYPHPRKVVDKKFPLGLISTKEEKENKLANLSLNHLIYIPFTDEFSNISANDFVKKILVDCLHVDTIVVGYDHRFGKNREGDIKLLRELSKEYNYKVEEISAKIIEETKVSSSKIRNAIVEGKIELANNFLNEQYFLSGIVVKGEQFGVKIGYPTANIGKIDKDKLLPKNGVYAVKIEINNTMFFGMLNIGFKPSVSNKNELSIEVNIFDFSDNIYDKIIKISFIKRIREEKKFSSIEDLKNQLKKDEIFCRSLFSISISK